MLQLIALLVALFFTVDIEVIGLKPPRVFCRSSYIQSLSFWKNEKQGRSSHEICCSLSDKNSERILNERATATSVATATVAVPVTAVDKQDPYHSFPLFDKLLFFLFSNSVTAEMERKSETAPKVTIICATFLYSS